MKKALILLAVLLSLGLANAQEPEAAQTKLILNTPPSLPEYVYCEISGYRELTLGNKVLFNFGQSKKDAKANLVTDVEGRELKFNSSIEALNYMVFRGWEFIQAYSYGADNDMTAMILQIQTSKLTEEQRQSLLAMAMTAGK